MLEGEILGANIERNTYRVILSINLSSQSVSHYDTTTLLPTEHMVHTHTLVFFFFFEPGGISASFCLLAGSHFRMICLLSFAFTYLLVGADLDENGPRR
jgi:hypothetical protein